MPDGQSAIAGTVNPRNAARLPFVSRPMRSLFFSCLCLVLPGAARAAVIGTNPPSQPLTADRIAALPAEAQPAWRDYLARSTRQRAADQKFLADELAAHGLKEALVPSEGRGFGRGVLTRPVEWYASAEAR